MRNIKTREGFEFWDKLNALPRYAFLLSPSGKSVQKFEDQAMGNWIDVHEAQKIVDQAQERISELQEEVARQKQYVEINANSAQGKHLEGQLYRDERDALQAELTKAREVIQQAHDRIYANETLTAYMDLRDYLSNQSAPADKGQGEPVAWMYRREGGECLGQLVQMESDTLKVMREGKMGPLQRIMWPREDCIDWKPLYAEQPAPVAVVLAEAREWLGDGKFSDGLAREHWTPEYAAMIDRIDATLSK